MIKSKISFYFIFVAFFTFITIFLTVVQSSYNNLINPVKQAEDNKLLEPLDPQLDVDIILEIESRQDYSQTGKEIIINSEKGAKTSVTPSVSITPTITNTPITTEDTTPVPTIEENN